MKKKGIVKNEHTTYLHYFINSRNNKPNPMDNIKKNTQIYLWNNHMHLYYFSMYIIF